MPNFAGYLLLQNFCKTGNCKISVARSKFRSKLLNLRKKNYKFVYEEIPIVPLLIQFCALDVEVDQSTCHF